MLICTLVFQIYNLYFWMIKERYQVTVGVIIDGTSKRDRKIEIESMGGEGHKREPGERSNDA